MKSLNMCSCWAAQDRNINFGMAYSLFIFTVVSYIHRVAGENISKINVRIQA